MFSNLNSRRALTIRTRIVDKHWGPLSCCYSQAIGAKPVTRRAGDKRKTKREKPRAPEAIVRKVARSPTIRSLHHAWHVDHFLHVAAQQRQIKSLVRRYCHEQPMQVVDRRHQSPG